MKYWRIKHLHLKLELWGEQTPRPLRFWLCRQVEAIVEVPSWYYRVLRYFFTVLTVAHNRWYRPILMPMAGCASDNQFTLVGKSSESVQCAITGPCLRMRHRPSAQRTVPIRKICPLMRIQSLITPLFRLFQCYALCIISYIRIGSHLVTFMQDVEDSGVKCATTGY